MSDEQPELLLRHQLMAMRAGALAQLAQIDATLALVGGGADEAAPAPAPKPEGCQHTKRLSAATMGRPKAWLCATPGCDGAGEE